MIVKLIKLHLLKQNFKENVIIEISNWHYVTLD
jgi:hypothetical protein